MVWTTVCTLLLGVLHELLKEGYPGRPTHIHAHARTAYRSLSASNNLALYEFRGPSVDCTT